MTKREAQELGFMTQNLIRLGFTGDEIDSLRRISHTLRNWFEAECGSDRGAIERDGEGKTRYRSQWSIDNGIPLEKCPIVPDREAGARKRLVSICKPHSRKVVPYVQTDCRGCALYLVTRKLMRKAAKRYPETPKYAVIDSIYSQGIAVY
jgi:hypothetical protein